MNECKSFIKIKARDFRGLREEEIIINVVNISSLEPDFPRPPSLPKMYEVRVGSRTYLIDEKDYKRIIKLIEQLGGNMNG